MEYIKLAFFRYMTFTKTKRKKSQNLLENGRLGVLGARVPAPAEEVLLNKFVTALIDRQILGEFQLTHKNSFIIWYVEQQQFDLCDRLIGLPVNRCFAYLWGLNNRLSGANNNRDDVVHIKNTGRIIKNYEWEVSD